MGDKEIFEYLGDGVYAKFNGHGIWLLANHHEHPTDKVYLEPSVLRALNRFQLLHLRDGIKAGLTRA